MPRSVRSGFVLGRRHEWVRLSMPSVPPFTRGTVSPLARALMVCGKLTVEDNLEKRRDSVLGNTKRSRTSDLMEVVANALAIVSAGSGSRCGQGDHK